MSVRKAGGFAIDGKAYSYTEVEMPHGRGGCTIDVWRPGHSGENDGVDYVVTRDEAGHVTCTCPDFLHRHAANHSLCKHAKLLAANGILGWPILDGGILYDFVTLALPQGPPPDNDGFTHPGYRLFLVDKDAQDATTGYIAWLDERGIKARVTLAGEPAISIAREVRERTQGCSGDPAV